MCKNSLQGRSYQRASFYLLGSRLSPPRVYEKFLKRLLSLPRIRSKSSKKASAATKKLFSVPIIGTESPNDPKEVLQRLLETSNLKIGLNPPKKPEKLQTNFFVSSKDQS